MRISWPGQGAKNPGPKGLLAAPIGGSLVTTHKEKESGVKIQEPEYIHFNNSHVIYSLTSWIIDSPSMSVKGESLFQFWILATDY